MKDTYQFGQTELLIAAGVDGVAIMLEAKKEPLTGTGLSMRSLFGDVLATLSSNEIGFPLCKFIGDFDVLNSGRTDVAYEDWQGYKLGRKLLALMQKA